MPILGKSLATWRTAWRQREVMDTYIFPVDGPGPAADPARSLVDATATLLERMRRDYPEDLTQRKYALLVKRLKHPADRTLVILDEAGEPCGYCHLTYGDTENARIGLRVPVSAQQGYFWDDHVFVTHRRRGLHAYSIARRLELLAADGRTEGLTMISRGNTASRASYAAFGAGRTRQHLVLRKVRRTISLPAWIWMPPA
ncbi:hypothetical protein [Ornithinimicrobium tianjinense]|nr:hypothetical protein [Ornithinimicrobium tianjinense]